MCQGAPWLAIRILPVLLFTVCGAPAHVSRHKRPDPPPTPANAAVTTPIADELKPFLSNFRTTPTTAQKGGPQDLQALNAKKMKELQRMQLRKRFHRQLNETVPPPSADEISKLASVFHEDSAPHIHHHREEDLSHDHRAAKKLAQRQQRRFKDAAVRSEDSSQCGAHVPAAELGIGRGAQAAGAFKQEAFLQGGGEPDEEDELPQSMANPGVGVNQTVADNGRSIMGTVGADKEEPFVTVYKDGFFLVGCYKDLMKENGDLHGPGKLRYGKNAAAVNISIVDYGTIVLKEKQKPMAPRTCFEFCRTVIGMVYFGLQGSTCYCTPYFEPTTDGVGSADTCDFACAGDDVSMCGGRRKVSIYEMHTCGNRGEELTSKALQAAIALSSYYATSLYAANLNKELQASGELLEEVAGLGGDPESAKYGREAKKYAGEVAQKLRENDCMDKYSSLLMKYEESEAISFSNMKKAENLQKADDATTAMLDGTPKVKECGKTAEKAVELGYPPYEEAMDATSDEDMMKLEEKYGTALVIFQPITFAIQSAEPPTMSTCTGKMLGKPMAVSFAECAQACDDMVHPDTCIGFQFFHLGGYEDHGGSKPLMRPLCFLLKEVKKITKYDCKFVEELTKDFQSDLKKEDFLQRDSVRGPDDDEEDPKISKAHCSTVENALMYSGMTCNELFGPDHSLQDTCKDACKRQDAAMLSATCMVKMSEIVTGMPNPKIDTKKRCFGGARNKKVSSPEGIDEFLVPFDEQGVVLSGDAVVGTSTVFEPIIWTAADEEKEL